MKYLGLGAIQFSIYVYSPNSQETPSLERLPSHLASKKKQMFFCDALGVSESKFVSFKNPEWTHQEFWLGLDPMSESGFDWFVYNEKKQPGRESEGHDGGV